MSGDLALDLISRRKIRLIRQTEVSECGLACITMIANYYGLGSDLNNVRRRFPPSIRGATLKGTIDTADALGLAPRALKVSLEQLPKLHLPAILHWDMNHFVVLEAVSGSKVTIHKPVGRTETLSLEEVSDHFTGVALELRPTSEFEAEDDRRRLKLTQLWRGMSGLKRALLQTFVLSLVLQLFVLVSPYYLQVAVDAAVPALDDNLLAILALGFGLFTLLYAAATLLRSLVLLSGGTALAYGISINIARRLFRLPVSWFGRRHVGDILARFQSITPIRQFMTEGAVAALLDGTMSILTFLIMLYYSPVLALVSFTAFVLYAVVRFVTFAAQRTAEEDTITTAGLEQTVLIESIRGIVTLRLFNKEAQRHSFWQSRLTDTMNARIRLSRIEAYQKAANTLIFGLEMVITVWIAIGLVIDGGFSLGMVFAYLAYKTQFLEKSASLTDQGIIFRMLGLHLERLSDIALAEQDVSYERQATDYRELVGKVELRKISFRYSKTDPVILRDLDLVVEPGEHIAITGASGGGKSTLIKLMLGLLDPDGGEILIDDTPIAAFGYKNYHDQVGAVLQDDNVFAGSLKDNVALFEDAPDFDRVVAACEAASLHDDIEAMPMRYDTLVGDMGSSLSGGQRQRLILARALYRNPTVLIVDEGTSALDAQKEQSVNAAIAKLGITRIVVAHRLETILNADRVYMMHGGKLFDATEKYDGLREKILD